VCFRAEVEFRFGCLCVISEERPEAERAVKRTAERRAESILQRMSSRVNNHLIR